jgi:L-lactate dehydrogenase complex protein LldE
MTSAVVFPTCLVELVRPDMAAAVVRVLEARGHTVTVAKGTTCCGQPAWNAGYVDDARRVAKRTQKALAKTTGPVVVPSGSCAAMMHEYWPELLGDTAVASRVVEFSAFLAASASSGDSPRPVRGESPDEQGSGVAYHDSCHMLRSLGIKEQPRALLGDAAELSERCCGFGGTFSVKLPEVSTAMADEKLDEVVAAGCDTLVGCDLSCLMHLEGRAQRRGLGLTVRHLAEVLDQRDGGAGG